MSVNKILLKSDRKVVSTLKMLQRNMRESKTPQPIGADILKMQVYPEENFGSVYGPYFVFGSGNWICKKFVPPSTSHGSLGDDILTVWQFAFTVFVDPTFTGSNINSGNNYPNGANIANIAGKIQVTNWRDWSTSNDAANTPAYNVMIQNNDVPHAFYIVTSFYFPEAGV